MSHGEGNGNRFHYSCLEIRWTEEKGTSQATVHGVARVIWNLATQPHDILCFWETSILFSTVAPPIYIPTNDIYSFLFLHISANICYLSSFDNSYSDRCDILIFLICIFWIINNIEHFFMCLLGNSVSSLDKCLFRSDLFFFF